MASEDQGHREGKGRAVSLHPLPFKEAVRALLETKPAKGKPEPRRERQQPPEDRRGAEDAKK